MLKKYVFLAFMAKPKKVASPPNANRTTFIEYYFILFSTRKQSIKSKNMRIFFLRRRKVNFDGGQGAVASLIRRWLLPPHPSRTWAGSERRRL